MKHNIIFLVLIGIACSNSNNAKEFYYKGQQAYLEKNLDEAEQYFNGSINSDNDFLNAYLMLAKISYHKRDYSKSLNYLNKILDLDSDHAGALYWKGRVLTMSGIDEHNEAVSILIRVLENNSHHIPARLLLALIYEKNGKYKEAMHEYIEAINEEESLINARGNLAVLYRRLGFKERALKEIGRAIKISELTGRDVKSLNMIKQEFERWEE